MYSKIILMTAAILLSGQTFAQSATDTTTPVVKTKNKKAKKKKTAAASAVSTPAAATTTTAAPAVEAKKEVAPAPAAAAAAPTQELSKADAFLKYMKDNFSLSYHGETYLLRRDSKSDDENVNKLGDVQHMSIPTLIYRPAKDWQILATAEFKYAKQPGGSDGTYNNRFHRALYTVTKKNILEEKTHGVKLDAGVGRRDYNTASSPTAWGNDRVFTTVTKNWGKHNASVFVQYLYNDPKKASASTWKHGLEIIPTINLQLTDKLTYMFNDDFNLLTPKFNNTAKDVIFTHEMNIAYVTYTFNDNYSVYYQFKYTREATFDANNNDYIDNYLGFAYAYNPKTTVTFEVGSRLITARDGHDFLGDSAHRPEFALYLDLAL